LLHIDAPARPVTSPPRIEHLEALGIGYSLTPIAVRRIDLTGGAAWLRAALIEPAHGLAALRIAVVGILLITPELHVAPSLAATPERLVASPEGLGWLGGFHFTPPLVAGVRVVAFSAGATALMGYWSRLSCAVLGLAATFLISFAQRAGAVLHDMHLLWLLGLLATSPCGDVWSLDAWGRAEPTPAPAYGVPLCFARLLLGVVYFFPGLHKLLRGGPRWGSAADITAIAHAKWFQHGVLPSIRIDELPAWLLTLGGVSVLVFELSFVVLALVRATRLIALVLGVAFHLSTQLFLFIAFPSLWICYVVLLPWQRLRAHRTLAPTSAGAGLGLPRASVATGLALLAAATVAGARGQTQAFPFACYPTFADIPANVAPDLIVDLVQADGRIVRIERDFRENRTQRDWAHIYSLLGAYGSAATEQQIGRFAYERSRVAGKDTALEQAVSVRLLVASYSTLPSDWGRPPLATRVLRQLEPDVVTRLPHSSGSR
jgi:hypothetical protein